MSNQLQGETLEDECVTCFGVGYDASGRTCSCSYTDGRRGADVPRRAVSLRGWFAGLRPAKL